MDSNFLSSFSILIIEDEEIVRQQLVEILSFDFKDIYDAPDAESALSIYKDLKPDIMLIDINLPNMSGLEFLEKIREDDHNTKAIMLTAHSEVEYLRKATSLKLTDYLIKPFSGKSLDDALAKAIEEIKKFKTTSTNILSLSDNFTWHTQEQELYEGTLSVKLTFLEKKLLKLLFTNQNIMMDYSSIIDCIWDDAQDDKMNALKTLIKKLRKKIPKDTILNVYKEGFIFKN